MDMKTIVLLPQKSVFITLLPADKISYILRWMKYVNQIIGLVLGMMLCGVIICMLHVLFDFIPVGLGFFLLLMIIPVTGWFLSIMIGQERQSGRLMKEELHKKDHIPHLLDAFLLPVGYRATKWSLDNLLYAIQDLKPDDDIELSFQQQRILNILIKFVWIQNHDIFYPNWTGKQELPVLLLYLVEKAGNSESLPALRSLAKGHGFARKRPDIQIAAKQALETLEARIREQNNPQTLLRAGNGPNNDLLRPVEAKHSNTTDSQELLRANSESRI